MTPIILIGAGRSGTKFLRSILSASDNVSSIPYDVGYVWRYGNESYHSDELKPEHLNDNIRSYIRKTLPSLVRNNGHLSKYFVEKSVPNSLRVKFIHKVYPDAKFVFLIRDGRAVTESSIRLWKAPSDKKYLVKKLRYFPWRNYRYAFWYIGNILQGMVNKRGQNIWGPRYDNIEVDSKKLPMEVVCARQWRKCVELAHVDLLSIPKEQVIQVKYEDFMKSSSELERICRFLKIPDADNVIQKFENTVEINNLDKWRENLTGNSLHLVEEEINSTLSKFGYID
ncbi:sulfotransferase [Vibrio sp. 1S139]|uniref:sulfotransferase family protein n=1 Tax=Vibrio sp. 1S139 TaxID=3230006 RepID=UPI00352F7CE5